MSKGKGLEIYRHSGAIPPAGVAVAVGGTVVGSSILGWLYTEFICGIPWIYINLLAVVVFGYAVGAVASWLVRLGKIRNANVSTALGFTGAFVGLYVAWAHDVTVRGLYEGATFSLSPGHIWAYVQDFNRDGGWTVNDAVPTGAALWAVWFMETVIVVGAAWNGSKDALENAVYCEDCQQWGKPKREVNKMARDMYDWVMDQLVDGNFEVLNNRMGDARARNHIRLDMSTCAGCIRSNYISLVGVSISTSDDGNGNRVETSSETTLGPPFKIPAIVANGFRTATPAWVEAGLDGPKPKRGDPRDRAHAASESDSSKSAAGASESASGADERSNLDSSDDERTRAQRPRRRQREPEDASDETRTRRQGRAAFDDAAKKVRRTKKKRRHMPSGVIALHCPHCDVESRIPSQFAGKRGKCPRCRGKVRVPER